MSYSLKQTCYRCAKNKDCFDGNIIASAVSIIHSIGPMKGHLGGGGDV